MRLTDLYIRQFRDLREEHLAMTGLRVLIGRNGAGKSSILDAIESLSEGDTISEPSITTAGHNPQTPEPGVFYIYELDDDLSEGPFISAHKTDLEAEYPPSYTRAVRSHDAFEMLCSLLGPASFDSFTKTQELAPGQTYQEIDVDLLEEEFERAKFIFGCANVDVLRDFALDKDQYTHLADRLHDWFIPVMFPDTTPQLKPHAELLKKIHDTRLEQARAIGSAVHRASGLLLDLALTTPRVAWSSGYRGVAVRRSDIPDDLKDDFESIINIPGHGDAFFESVSTRVRGGQVFAEWEMRLDLFTEELCRGFEWGSRAPVIDAALQWDRGAPFILVRLTPDVGTRLPWDDHAMSIEPIGRGALTSRDPLHFPF